MKKIGFLFVCLAFAGNAWALGGYATLSGDEKKVADAIKSNLSVSEEDAYQIFDIHIKGYLDSKDWQYNSFNNESLTSSKVQKSSNKALYLNFVTDNRFINVSLIKFSAEKQVQIHALETLPRSSQTAIEKYNSLKADSAYSIDQDKAEFSVFTKKGYIKYVKIMVYSGVGTVQYIDFGTYDLKK